MPLTLNANEARKADNFSSVIRDTGKYICTITRAQKLLSKRGTEGVGFSVKTEDGATANYLDVYTVNAAGKALMGNSIVNAILCCAKVREAVEGPIEFDVWDNNERRMVKASAEGYPALMGKKIGLVLQRELSTRDDNGEDQDRMTIAAVFEANTGFMASEILAQATKPEKLDKIVATILANPIKDRRKKLDGPNSLAVAPHAAPLDDSLDSIPF
ncbi:MAG TPA: hypothetical protein VEC57_20855 [Candidatus Limnocylindrales bacterium]|nr:hypothetical protein [Candidatus Limnocylindrales bacterium]